MDNGRIHRLLKKYREENKTAIREMKISLEATVSHFNVALAKMEAANEEFASEISDHIIDLDVRVTLLEKKGQ